MSKYQVGIGILVAATLIGLEKSPHSLAASPVVSDGPTAVLVDSGHGRRWELTWASVTAYDIASGKRLRTLRLPHAIVSGARESCPPAMVLDRNGGLYVSSNVEPRLWRISPSLFEIEILDVELESDRDKEIGFTRLAWSANEGFLQAVNAATGTLWQIDLATGRARKVGRSADYQGCAVRY
jgi:outer membrane protein assembly factor BamB